MAKKSVATKASTIKAAFGAKNRDRLLAEYFSATTLADAKSAWIPIYRLLLWVDQTTGLAHCYESDKSQPGKHWYPRTLAFHDWLSSSLNIQPTDLANEIDWLFRRATADLAAYVVRNRARLVERARDQRKPFAHRTMPNPGEDPVLTSIVRDVLKGHFSSEPSDDEWRELVQRIRQHLSLENKRKNLVGEGFEDVLVATLRQLLVSKPFTISARQLVQQIVGFKNERAGDKPNKVDVVLINSSTARRVLVTAKWSIRADREKQFPAEFGTYVNANASMKPFEYVLVTNEFDPARLVRACEAMAANSHLFTKVVHISTDALSATYGNAPEDSMKRVIGLIADRRLVSFADWATELAH